MILCSNSYLSSVGSITPSGATATKVIWFKQQLKITKEKTVTAARTLEFYGATQPPNYQFIPLQPVIGDQKTKVTAAMNHLRAELAHFVPNLDNCFCFKNVCDLRRLWEMTLNEQMVRGTTDIVIVPQDAAQDEDGFAPEILMLFELKGPPAHGQPVNWKGHIRQVKFELMIARCTSRRPLVLFLTDFVSGALTLRVSVLPDDTFEIVQSELTLNEMAQVAAAHLKPEYKTVDFEPDELMIASAGPVRDAVQFKRKFDEVL